MDSTSHQLQYQGYFHTPLLWENHTVLTLRQLVFSKHYKQLKLENPPQNIVLGKLVEYFVYQELNSYKNIRILMNNIQVQQEKITVGEIDCLLRNDSRPIHLEVVYKFYLYDPEQGGDEIAKWVGPNKKDNLLKKLTKLKEKQLPLLYNPLSRPVLEKVGLSIDELEQFVYFKAQLFVPYKSERIVFDQLNEDCVRGFYIPFNQLKQLEPYSFYIPIKPDWLIDPHQEVDWMDFNEFYKKVSFQIEQNKSPLCWIKLQDKNLQKCFVVFW